jgi:hypothetical protein
MKIIYTAAAKPELDAFHFRQQASLESLVAKRKSVLGDDVLEITASDIKDAAKDIGVHQRHPEYFRRTRLVTSLYIFAGISLMVGAFFYPRIVEILAENKTQALVFLMGTILTAIGAVFRIWTQGRERDLVLEEYTQSLKTGINLDLDFGVDAAGQRLKEAEQSLNDSIEELKRLREDKITLRAE